MNFFQITILGIVEGITEFLPISSTGHLILTARVLGLKQTEFLKTFEIVIQMGAILSVIVLYGKSLVINSKVLKRVIVAFIPTAFVGFILYKVIKEILFVNYSILLGAMFCGGAALIIFEFIYRGRIGIIEEIVGISYRKSLLI